MVEGGGYNRNPEKYKELVEELYRDHPPMTLPSEYAYFIEKDLLRFLIRLARYKFVARLIKKTDHVLEVGSGNGMGSIFLSQHCAHVTGLEVKTHEVEEAISINRRQNVTFKVEDLFNVDDSLLFDVVVALDVIEHMDAGSGSKLLAKMARNLKPNGMLVIGTPSIYSYEYQSAFSKASHVKCYDQQEMISLLDEHFGRTLAFSMNDELVHTGHPKMAWYYFFISLLPKTEK